MPARGTMGIRMSRIQVDGLLNNTSYWRAFPSNTARYTLGIEVPVTGTAYQLYAAKTVPAGLLPGSLIRVYRDIKVDYGASLIHTVLQKNGVADGATHHQTNSLSYTSFYDDIQVAAGDIIGVYAAMNDAFIPGHINNMKICCEYDGVIEAKGPAGWP